MADSYLRIRSAVALTVTLAFGAGAMAQATDTDDPPADEQSETTDAPPSLDELLGLDEDSEGEDGITPEEAAERESEDELQRRLREEEIVDAFVAAIEKMDLSADFLDERFDPGLGTQRVQEDILAKLDQLIDMARKTPMPSPSSSSSSSSSSSQSQQQPQPQTSQQQQQQQNSGERNQQASDSQEGDPAGRQDGDINKMIDETRIEWGNLPPRVRDQLLQGRSDKYSSHYERLTREYYRRLAEEGSP